MYPFLLTIVLGKGLVVGSPGFQQSFWEAPEDVSVLEHHSVVLRCKIRNLAGSVQWTSDGFAMGYSLETIRNFCKKCEPFGDTSKGEYHLKVNNVELSHQNDFECQVTPDPENRHSELRASAHINVLVPPKNMSLEPGDSVEMKTNQPSKLTCRVWGTNPQANILWLRDGQRILDQEVHESFSSGRRNGTFDTENTLTFTPSPGDDGATITCRVEQKHELLRGRFIEAHSKLTVLYPPEGPVIHGYNNNKGYKEGDQINITCQAVGGNPAPTVVWFRGPNNTKQDIPFFKQDDVTYSVLTLRASSRDHGSVYTCQAWNNITQFSLLSLPVYLNVSFSPDVVEITGPDYVELGKSVSLICSAENSNPPAKLYWIIDGESSQGTVRQELSTEGGYKTYSTKEVFAGRTDEKIQVSCTARAADREKKVTKKISIKRPPEKPVITGFPRHTVREGDILTLECTSQKGSPVPELEWRKEGTRLADQVHSKVDDTYALSKLTIKVVRQDNLAEYSCQASNGVNFVPAVQKENFTVYFPPVNANLYMTRLAGGPALQIATAGESVELHCESETSNPAPKFNWRQNGVQVLNGVSGDEGPGKFGGKLGSHIFKINNGLPVRPEDNGNNYTCTTYNPTIQGHKLINNFILHVRYKPQFAAEVPRVYSVREAEDITVQLEAVGNPNNVQYNWHNHLALTSSRTRLKFEDAKMTIRKASREDEGTYILFASNSVGQSELQIKLEVFYPARIVSVSSMLEVEEGDTVNIFCKVDAKPLTNSTVRWNGPLGFNSREDGLVNFDGKSTFTLTLPRVHKTNRGTYRCTADNGVQSAVQDTRDTQLQIHFAPEIRKFVRYSKFSENRMFPTKIPCYAYGYPEVSIFWEKEEEGRLNSHRFSYPADGKAKQTDSGTWLSELLINPVENSDFTQYRCFANNSLGSDSHIIRIVHNSEPDPISKLEVKQYENKTVRLRWEPGFNGGFKQEFVYRVREVSSDRIIYEGVAKHEEIGEHQEYIQQYIILERLGDYAFSIKSRNIQGDSPYSREQFESLKAAEVQGPEESKLPRVVIVAIVLGSILAIIIKLIVITCCVKQRKETRRRDRERLKDRHSSESSRKSMVIERYPPKYSTTFGEDLYLSPPSHNSGSSYSEHQDHYKHVGRSLSVPGEPSEGHTSYTSCSVHGTLGRQISSGIDTTLEDDVFDDLTRGSGNIHHSGSIHHSSSIHHNNSIHHSGSFLHNSNMQQSSGSNHHPSITADRMLRSGGGRRSRAGSLSSPSTDLPPPRLGISGLYTDYLERQKHSTGGSVSPPSIPSPPPPIDISTLGRRLPMPPPPPSVNRIPNGQVHAFDLPRGPAEEMSKELSRRIHEMGSNPDLDPPDSMGHLHLDNFSPFPHFSTNPPFNSRTGTGPRTGGADKYRHNV